MRKTTTAAEVLPEERPPCPACGADAAMQEIASTQADGALKLAILTCATCAEQHPVWF